MSRTWRGKLLRISSEDKSPGETNARFSVNLNNASFVQEVKTIAFKSCSFTHVFCNLYGTAASGNLTMTYEYGGVDSSVTIAKGWYSASELMAALNIEFAADPVITGSVVVTLTPNPTVSSSSFLFTSDSALKVYGKTTSPMADVLGVGDEQPAALVVTMPYKPDLGGLGTVYLVSNVLAGVNSAASSNDGETVSIVAEIPINIGFGGKVNHVVNDGNLETITYQHAKQLTNVDFALVTRSGQVLDLQQHNLTAVFRIVGQREYGHK